MATVNKVMLIGNLTRDPELRRTPKGTAVTDLGLALNRAFSTEGGERREEVTYVDVTVWGRTAEVANEYLSKGKPVFVEGRLHMDQWDDKATGQKRTKLKVVGESIQLLGTREGGRRGDNDNRRDELKPPPDRGETEPNQSNEVREAPASLASFGDQELEEPDDIPF